MKKDAKSVKASKSTIDVKATKATIDAFTVKDEKATIVEKKSLHRNELESSMRIELSRHGCCVVADICVLEMVRDPVCIKPAGAINLLYILGYN